MIWEDEQSLDRLPPTANGADIPVYFAIPAGEHPTSPDGGAGTCWRLDVIAPTAGINYRSRFKVPVFVVDRSNLAPLSDLAAPFRHQEDGAQIDRIPGISVSTLSDGGRVIHFAAARNRVSAMFVSLLGLSFTMISAFFFGASVPIIMAIVFGVAALITDIGAINSWLSSSTVAARPGSLVVTRGLPFLRHHHEVPVGTLSDIVIATSSQILGVSYYSLSAITTGQTTRLASGIRGKEIAERLADEMKQALGLKAAV